MATATLKITADENEKKLSEKFYDSLESIQECLTKKTEVVDETTLNNLFETVKDGLTRVNSTLHFVSSIFKMDGVNGASVELDEPNVLDFLSNMQKSKRILQYLSIFIPEMIRMQKLNEGEGKEVSSDFLNGLIKVAS